jgi:hypothetical protein
MTGHAFLLWRCLRRDTARLLHFLIFSAGHCYVIVSRYSSLSLCRRWGFVCCATDTATVVARPYLMSSVRTYYHGLWAFHQSLHPNLASQIVALDLVGYNTGTMTFTTAQING